jgi:N-acetylglutamate synthase-like GNAT family acetyltransferase
MARATDVLIRKMREADRPAAMDILAYWNMAPRPPTAQVPDPERSDLVIENSFVAVADGAVVGVASYILREDRSAETASLAVSPAWLGSFVGEQLQDARLAEMKARGVERVRTESDRSEIVDWYVRKYGYRVVGSAQKKHSFGLEHVDHWTVLELDLRAWRKVQT